MYSLSVCTSQIDIVDFDRAAAPGLHAAKDGHSSRLARARAAILEDLGLSKCAMPAELVDALRMQF